MLDHDAVALDSPRQQTLLIHCLNGAATWAAATFAVTPANVLIEGGESITNIAVEWVALAAIAAAASAMSLEQGVLL